MLKARRAVLFCTLSGLAVAAEKPPPLSFNTHVQPILSEHCYSCHGPDSSSRKAGLRLDHPEFAFAPHEKSGPAIIAGDAEKSPLVRRITAKNANEVMPPPEAHQALKPEEIALLRRWVAEGAKYEPHWAFIRPQRPPVPALHASAPAAWRHNAIDAFILARLDQEQLAPAPEADRRALIRRVSYDLGGLPPSPAEVEAFVADPAPDAYERLVDRLLASGHYAEHRARYWLDYVRYADTHGISYDNYRSIWPYRDYVIRAFDANKPFDRFVREQLAGDLLPARSLDELVATGYVRSNLSTNEGGTISEEVFVAQTRDRVEALGATFLGLTIGCAACHDHKFDPTTQRDFYQLSAFFTNTANRPWDDNAADPPPVVRLPQEADRAAVDAALAQRGKLQAQSAARRRDARQLVGQWLAAGNQPRKVASDALELRLQFDEGRGDRVKNSAPGAATPVFKATVNPLIWGETTWLWPAMRMDMGTRLALGTVGDVEVDDAFSAGGWLQLRQNPGLGGIGTGNGALLSRMGDARRHHGRGWELYQRGLHFEVNLVDEAGVRAIQVRTKPTYERDQWYHVFFTYDGSQRARGVRIYVNGHPVETETTLDTLGPTREIWPVAAFQPPPPPWRDPWPGLRLALTRSARPSIRTDATTQLGRRDDYEPMRETRFQDVRFYRRILSPEEVRRLPFEDVAADIVARQPDPSKWTTDEAFVIADRFYLGEIDAEAARLTAGIAALDATITVLCANGTPSLIAQEKPTPAYADILKRGDYAARLERVEPDVPHFLPPMAAGSPRNRLGLANWLLAPENPLLARVTVNRMWQEIFGRGLVETAGDFGVMGARPSHPELLDWLAVEFRESGWDVKKFYRQLVLSATYRQSAVLTARGLALDPDNRLLGRGPRFRLDAEMIRDAALQVSGLLVDKMGGPSVKPYQPPGLWEEGAVNGSNTTTYKVDQGEGLYRRSLYTFWKRSSPPPSLEAFDAPAREIVCPRRPRSNTPLQALVTMNDPQFVEAARKLAERALHTAPQAAARLACLAALTLNRELTAPERAALEEARHVFAAQFAAQPDAAKELLTVGDSPADPAIDPTELAEWTLVASQFMNLDEFLTK